MTNHNPKIKRQRTKFRKIAIHESVIIPGKELELFSVQPPPPIIKHFKFPLIYKDFLKIKHREYSIISYYIVELK